MVKKQFKILIVGLGNIGLKYDLGLPENYVLSHSRAFHLNENFQIIGGVDNDKNSRDLFEQNYPYKSYNSTKEALKETIPDGIIICTPPNSQLKIIKDVLKNNKIKFIVCEKPFTTSFTEAEKAVKICSEKTTAIFVNYQRNSSLVTKEIMKRINQNEIKPPFKIIHCYSKGLENSCSHFISFFNMLFGEVLETSLITNHNVEKKDEKLNRTFKLNYNFAEIIFSPLDFKYTFNGFKMYCENGLLEYNNNGIEINWYGLKKARNNFPQGKIIEYKKNKIESDFYYNQLSFCNELYKALIGEKGFISTGKDALYVRKILNKLKV